MYKLNNNKKKCLGIYDSRKKNKYMEIRGERGEEQLITVSFIWILG